MNAEALGSLMAAEMEKINAEGAAFNQQVQEQQSKMGSVYEAMFSKLTQPKQQPLAPEVQQIVSILQAQPRLVPFVLGTLQKKVAELNAAIDGILKTD